jgi:ABC-2 type transport system permease protein
MPNSIWKIAKTEVRLLVRDGVFRAAALFLTAAALAALLAGVSHYRRQQRLNRQATMREQVRWRNQPPRDPHSATHFGQTAFHQLGLLSAFDSGVDPYAGVTVFLESHRRNFPRFPWAADAARMPGPGHFTASTAWRVLLPLLIILLAHGALSRERESGMFGLLLSSGVSPRSFLMGKFLGQGLAITAVALPLALATAAAIWLVSPISPPGDWLPRAFGLALAYAAYGFAYLAITLAASAMLPSTAAARALLLAFWAVTALVLPRVLVDISQTLHPAPAGIEVEQAIANDPDRLFGPKRRAELTHEVLAKYKVESIKDLPVNFNGLVAQKAEEHSNQLIDRHFRLLEDNYRAAARWVASWSWVSPSLAIDGVSMALSGSDLSHYDYFLQTSEDHRRMMVRMLNEEQARHPVREGEKSYRAGAQVWQSIPTFNIHYPRLGWAVTSNMASFLALGGWVAACGVILAWIGGRRWA